MFPLSRQALSILKELHQNKIESESIIFSHKSKKISGNAVRKLIHSIHKRAVVLGYSGFADPFERDRIIVPHGFRAAFTTWAQETNKNMMLVEKCLAHKDPEDRHNGAYRRGMLIVPRKILLQQWANFCFSKVQSHFSAVQNKFWYIGANFSQVLRGNFLMRGCWGCGTLKAPKL